MGLPGARGYPWLTAVTLTHKQNILSDFLAAQERATWGQHVTRSGWTPPRKTGHRPEGDAFQENPSEGSRGLGSGVWSESGQRPISALVPDGTAARSQEDTRERNQWSPLGRPPCPTLAAQASLRRDRPCGDDSQRSADRRGVRSVGKRAAGPLACGFEPRGGCGDDFRSSLKRKKTLGRKAPPQVTSAAGNLRFALKFPFLRFPKPKRPGPFFHVCQGWARVRRHPARLAMGGPSSSSPGAEPGCPPRRPCEETPFPSGVTSGHTCMSPAGLPHTLATSQGMFLAWTYPDPPLLSAPTLGSFTDTSASCCPNPASQAFSEPLSVSLRPRTHGADPWGRGWAFTPLTGTPLPVQQLTTALGKMLVETRSTCRLPASLERQGPPVSCPLFLMAQPQPCPRALALAFLSRYLQGSLL